MIESVLASKNLVAALLACATGLPLYFRYPFPADNLVLRLIAIIEDRRNAGTGCRSCHRNS